MDIQQGNEPVESRISFYYESRKVIAECDVFGLGPASVKLVFYSDYPGKLPGPIRRFFQWFFIGSKWTFPKDPQDQEQEKGR